MDGPKCNSSFTKTIQAYGESSSVQDLDPRRNPSLLDKLQAPWLSDLGRKQCVHVHAWEEESPFYHAVSNFQPVFFFIFASGFSYLGGVIVRIMGQNKRILG